MYETIILSTFLKPQLENKCEIIRQEANLEKEKVGIDFLRNQAFVLVVQTNFSEPLKTIIVGPEGVL